MEFLEPNVHFSALITHTEHVRRVKDTEKVIELMRDLVVPNKTLSIYEDAVVCWRGETMSEWKKISSKKQVISYPQTLSSINKRTEKLPLER